MQDGHPRESSLKADQVVDEEGIRTLAIKNGMQTLRRAGIELLKRGTTSMEEIASVTMEED